MSESFIQWVNRVFVGKKEKELSDMTKIELELKGREIGVELDRRYTKDNLIKKLEKHLGV
jgi:hypothetical protein|tara:strand:- start:860 stop:1039 length:180 start_codon:yes stop_codon:yes gene_type:complete